MPRDQYYVADGLCVRVVAKHQGELRQITFASNGDLFGVTTSGAIRRYRDLDHDGAYDGAEIVEWASTGGDNGHNAEIDERGGYLYAGSKDGVKRWKYGASIDRGGSGESLRIVPSTSLPLA